MALGVRQHDPARDGTLEAEEFRPSFVEIYFVPPEHSLFAARLDPKSARSHRSRSINANINAVAARAALSGLFLEGAQ